MPKTITEAYDELWHYTSAAGAQGIISSGSLWATSAEFLNDPTEIKHFFDVRMHELVKPLIHRLYEEMAENPANYLSQLKTADDLETNIKTVTQALVAQYRSATLHVNAPHIFSMTVPAPTDPHSSSDGLLSQWRGYGPDGGCALVFDPSGLDSLLREEKRSFSYQYMLCGDVYYYGATHLEQPSTEDIAQLEENFAIQYSRQLRGQNPKEERKFYETITSLSCLYKHRGFHEEREVRIIAVPSLPKISEDARKDGEDLPQKSCKTFIRSGIHVPYIELFSYPNQHRTHTHLPIKRVVIGPGINAEHRRRSVERLLRIHGYSVPVDCSEIPFIGR